MINYLREEEGERLPRISSGGNTTPGGCWVLSRLRVISARRKGPFLPALFIALLFCGLVCPATALVHNPPWGDNYDFVYRNMITTPSALNAAQPQTQMGYFGWDWTGEDASTAYSRLKDDDAIFSFSGHAGGAPGRLKFYAWDGTYSYITASKIGTPYPVLTEEPVFHE